jgi:hypothetical protein
MSSEWQMRYTRSHAISGLSSDLTLVLFICLVCPIVEMFDSWDHTIQTGNDTENALVVLALCVGVAYLFARFIFQPILLGLVVKNVHPLRIKKVFFFARGFGSLLLDETNPPPRPLRI